MLDGFSILPLPLSLAGEGHAVPLFVAPRSKLGTNSYCWGQVANLLCQVLSDEGRKQLPWKALPWILIPMQSLLLRGTDVPSV